MPKLKTNKSARRRFKITATGKVMRMKSLRRHLLTDRKASKKRKLRRATEIHPSNLKEIRRHLPYESAL